MSASAGNCPDLLAAREAIELACRTFGRKRGWHIAAQMLGVTERRVESIVYGERVARIAPQIAQQARNTLARQRAAAIRAELGTLEGGTNEGTILDALQQVLGVVR